MLYDWEVSREIDGTVGVWLEQLRETTKRTATLKPTALETAPEMAPEMVQVTTAVIFLRGVPNPERSIDGT